MPLPEFPRVIYGKNPLEVVICQLRFPPILRIGTQLPAEFQERIRRDFPDFRERSAALGLPAQLAQAMPVELSISVGARTFDFLSLDERWQVALNQQHLALSTRDYRRWEQFKAHLEGPLRALLEVYAPAYYSRVGLRYRDVVLRSALGLGKSAWSELLKPAIAAELASPDVANDVEHAAREFVLRLPNGGKVRVKHGLVTAPDGEACFVIDADFFLEAKTEIADASTVLDSFNRQAGRLFRWCISERLHEAMDPAIVG